MADEKPQTEASERPLVLWTQPDGASSKAICPECGDELRVVDFRAPDGMAVLYCVRCKSTTRTAKTFF